MSSSPPRRRQRIDSSSSFLPVEVASSRFRPYSDLPIQILHEICRRSVSFRCYLAMCRVCKHWSRCLLQYPCFNLRSKYPCFNPLFPPYLLLPREPSVARIACHDVFGNAHAPLIDFPQAAWDLVHWSIACNHNGWLVMVKESFAVIWNCLSNHRFSLPPLSKGQTIWKIILPPHVVNGTKIAAIIRDGYRRKRLAFCRIGDSFWSYFPNLPYNKRLRDILYMHEYVLLFQNWPEDDFESVVCVLVTLDPETLEVRTFDLKLPFEASCIHKMYLCSSGSKLYIILRYYTNDACTACGLFSVYFHVAGNRVEARRVRTLDDAYIFVGRDFCVYMSVPAAKTIFYIEQYLNEDKTSDFYDVCDVYSVRCDLETEEDVFSILSWNKSRTLTKADYVIGKSTRPMWFLPHISDTVNIKDGRKAKKRPVEGEETILKQEHDEPLVSISTSSPL